MAKKKRYPHTVCKPCWELHYCPYGSLVEYSPHSPEEQELSHIEKKYKQLIHGLAAGLFKTEDEIHNAVRWLLFYVPGKWKHLQKYDTRGMECNVFGHICPVFLAAEAFTETWESRRAPSRYIPREVMLKVARRDAGMCQLCHLNVPDNEMVFDHLIPVSRGGPSTVANLRVLCIECNSLKSDSLREIVESEFVEEDPLPKGRSKVNRKRR
jgi:hypothetical protein